MVALDSMVTLDVEVKLIVDVLYPAVVDGLNERVGMESGVSTARMKKQKREEMFFWYNLKYAYIEENSQWLTHSDHHAIHIGVSDHTLYDHLQISLSCIDGDGTVAVTFVPKLTSSNLC